MRPLQRSPRSYRFAACCCIVWLVLRSHPSDSQVQQAEGGFLVEGVTGSAPIYNNNVEAATDAAVRAALNRALEQKVGVRIKSERLTVDATMLSQIIQAHSSGYARFLGSI